MSRVPSALRFISLIDLFSASLMESYARFFYKRNGLNQAISEKRKPFELAIGVALDFF